MSTFTENYNLIKPSEEDYYDVQDFNENMDTIDTQMMETEQAITAVSNKIGTPEDTGNDTIFGKLTQLSQNTNGVRTVKSIQKVSYTVPGDSNTGSCSISAVNPSRCLVIMERQYNLSNSPLINIAYTLNATSIFISHGSQYANSAIVNFWVIEFY